MKIENLTIGSKIFVVHEDYAHKNKKGGRVSLARITGFVNRNNVIEPEFKLIGVKSDPETLKRYYAFTDINLAIEAIKTVLT
jgi:hypothetical protein